MSTHLWAFAGGVAFCWQDRLRWETPDPIPSFGLPVSEWLLQHWCLRGSGALVPGHSTSVRGNRVLSSNWAPRKAVCEVPNYLKTGGCSDLASGLSFYFWPGKAIVQTVQASAISESVRPTTIAC